MTAEPTDNATLPTAKPCGVCWFGETPKTPAAGCPCCENSHYGGHFDLDGNPQ